MGQVEFFDSVAKNWDNMIEVNDNKINYLLSKLKIKEDNTILDIGTGTGVLIPFLYNLAPRGMIRGLDISSGMLQVAKAKFGNLENVSFHVVNVEKEKIHSKYDRIVLYSMYPHLENKTETIKKLVKENLNPKGILMIAHSNSRDFLNNLHSNGDDRVKESLLLEVNEQKRVFEKAGLYVMEAFEDDEMYYVVIHNS